MWQKRPESSSVTRVTHGVITSKDKTRVLLPSPFAFLHYLNAKGLGSREHLIHSIPSTRLTVALEISKATSTEVH